MCQWYKVTGTDQNTELRHSLDQDDPGRGAGPGGGQQDICEVSGGGAQCLAPATHPPPLSESGDGRQVTESMYSIQIYFPAQCINKTCNITPPKNGKILIHLFIFSGHYKDSRSDRLLESDSFVSLQQQTKSHWGARLRPSHPAPVFTKQQDIKNGWTGQAQEAKEVVSHKKQNSSAGGIIRK